MIREPEPPAYWHSRGIEDGCQPPMMCAAGQIKGVYPSKSFLVAGNAHSLPLVSIVLPVLDARMNAESDAS
jgi:hypothetical protein